MTYVLLLIVALPPRVAIGAELVISQDPALTCPSAAEVRVALQHRLGATTIEDHASAGVRAPSLQLRAVDTRSFEIVYRLDTITLRRVLPIELAACATTAITVALLTDTWMHSSIEPEPTVESSSPVQPPPPSPPSPTRGLRLRVGLAGGVALGLEQEPLVPGMATLDVELEGRRWWGVGARVVVSEFLSGFRPITGFGDVRLFERGATRLSALVGVSVDINTRATTTYVRLQEAAWAGARWDWQAWSRYSAFAELAGSSLVYRDPDFPLVWAELTTGVACRF